MLNGLLFKMLIKAVVLALVGLILYGIFPGGSLVNILLLIVGWRITSLVAEALRKPEPTAERLKATGLAERVSQQRGKVRWLASPTPGRSSIWDVLLAKPMPTGPPRSKRELLAEALGVVAFALLLPLDVAIYTREIVSIPTSQGWEGMLVAAVCIGLYG